MKNLLPLVIAAALLVASTDAFALCGDVTGDHERTTVDALAVLRSAVGHNVDLVCTDTTPSQIRFFNEIVCGGEDDTSQLRFSDSDEDYAYEAAPGEFTIYESVDEAYIESIEIDLCGETYAFDTVFSLAPARFYTLFLVLLDPEVYGEGVVQAILYDDGQPVEAVTSSGVLGSFEQARGIGLKK